MHPLLDLRISVVRLWPSFLGRWRLIGQAPGEGWSDLKKGRGEAIRPIRLGLRRYWVGLSYSPGKISGYFSVLNLYTVRPDCGQGDSELIGATWFGSLRGPLKELKARRRR